MQSTDKSHQGLLIGPNRQPSGWWQLAIGSVDGFGTQRAGQFGFLTFPKLRTRAKHVQLQGANPTCCSELKNIFVCLPRFPDLHANDLLSACAESFNLVVDSEWPLFASSRKPKPLADARLNPRDCPPRPAGYDIYLEGTEIDKGAAQKIAALQARLELEAADCVAKDGFKEKYEVRRIMTVGSTSRQTYANIFADFDLVIETRTAQDGISRSDLRRVVDELIFRISVTPEFTAYCDLIQRTVPLSPRPAIYESFFGVRGTQSFVSRHELAFGAKRHNLFDVTFGNLPQLIGYESWIQRYLRELGSSGSKQIQREVRLAKRLLSKMGGLYELGTPGFRGNVVEQFVIQGRDYRGCGTEIGSLANSLTLIAEEVGPDLRNLTFDEYKAKFPLWHPGWWETELGFAQDQQGVNILNLFGGGDAERAERQWTLLKALALSHQRCCHSKIEWTLETIVSDAHKLLAAHEVGKV